MSLLNDGGYAFPHHFTTESINDCSGMSLRDYFAAKAPTDEVQELSFRHLSRVAQEQLTGLKYPEKPKDNESSAKHVSFQIEQFKFKCAVNAAIRFALADAMLKVRGAQ